MKDKQKTFIWKNSAAPILLLAVGVIFAYAFLAYPCYTAGKIGIMKRIFQEISDMDLSPLDEEDVEILQDYYRSDRYEITVADEALSLVYTNCEQKSGGNIEAHIMDHQEEYQNPPTVYVRRNKLNRVIRLRGLVTQKNSQSVGVPGVSVSYYVYIRKEIRSVGEFIWYTLAYFGAAFLVLTGLWYFYRPKRGALNLMETGKDLSGQELLQMHKEFVANVSHELKTPLSVISAQVEMLQSMGEEIDRDYYFSSIREEIDKMSGMVGNLLDITSIEHRIQEMEMGTVNLSDTVEYLILKYDALFQQNKLRLHKEVAENCIVRANHMYLEQAINNYIMNAFQHTGQGCEIGIRLVREKKYAALFVYNEGERIASENLEHIWQGFYMGSKDSSRQKTGKLTNAGLGLYLVKMIVGQHQGSCGVENRENGVEFWMRIPLV